jgi:hypothetical protein
MRVNIASSFFRQRAGNGQSGLRQGSFLSMKGHTQSNHYRQLQGRERQKQDLFVLLPVLHEARASGYPEIMKQPMKNSRQRNNLAGRTPSRQDLG